MHEIGKAVIVAAMLISPDARSLGQKRFGAIDDEGNRDTLPNKYNIRLIRQEAAALQTATFYFERPTEFQFTAGQFIEMTISSVELSKSDGIHTFSISSAPCEEWIAITTRLRDSSFKRALSQLEPGNVVEIDGPYGNFVVSPDVRRPVAFLVGGVGITPAVSILKQAAQDSALAGFCLFYSNRVQTEAPFLTELSHIQAGNPEFHLIATMTADQSWMGERERISMDMIRRYMDPEVASFFISGPPNMVTGMRNMLTTAGITREQVRFEAFAGY